MVGVVEHRDWKRDTVSAIVQGEGLICWSDMSLYPAFPRDMKSSNCLMKYESGECVIADLGLALQLDNIDNPQEISNYGQVSALPCHVTVM